MAADKIHTTNYYNTFIKVADDCPVTRAETPASKGDKKSVAEMQYELLSKNPYKFTSDDIFFQVFADRNELTKAEYKKARKEFFSKGKPCFRASPLTKRYGFGVHSNKDGKVALYGIGTAGYQKFVNDPDIKKVSAMRTSK